MSDLKYRYEFCDLINQHFKAEICDHIKSVILYYSNESIFCITNPENLQSKVI